MHPAFSRLSDPALVQRCVSATRCWRPDLRPRRLKSTHRCAASPGIRLDFLAMASQNQSLPSKEGALFKQLVKLYEDKLHKKAIKTADQILKKYPDHGETLAMKGLTLSNMGPEKKEEAYELVRKGVKADLKSYVCWHAYGLLYRADRDYREAIKCYLNALRMDKDNIQILRDLATLQIQMRDLPGFVETRQRLLALKPSHRGHWITFALAHHANKAYDVAVQVLDSYEGSLSEVPASEAYEHSELLLYKATLLDEGGKLEEAINLLDTQKHKLKDQLGMLEHRASLLLRLRRPAEAERQYRALIASNPDHYRYHEQLQACLGLRPAPNLTAEQRTGLQSLYSELATTYPRSSACKRIPLDFLQGEAFEAAADAYVRPYLTKGIPSLFMDVRPLYSDASKVASLERLFLSYSASLLADGCFPSLLSASTSTSNGHMAGVKESPQTRVWVLYYLAQHYDRLRDHSKALTLLGEAEAHTPTLIELFTLRSKLLRHAGDMEGAVHAAETARRADLSDRYLNSMAVKAMLRANKVDAAEKTAALFLKDDAGGLSALQDMQHMWFEVAAGDAHLRRAEHGRALKRFLAVTSHFDDIHEDQFDFHGYCVRKTTLRAYVATLRMEDQLFGHPFYLKAVRGAIHTYLAIADAPSAATKEADEEALLATMTAEERKKYKLKKKKEEKSKAREAEEAVARAEAAAKEDKAKAAGDKKKGGQAAAEKKDADPDGAKLAAVEDPLAEAAKLVVSLKQHASSALDTHVMAAEVYLRRKRILLALAAAQAAKNLAGAEHPDVHRAVVKVCRAAADALSGPQATAHPTVRHLITNSLGALLGPSADVGAYNAAWVAAQECSSLPHRMSAAETVVLLGGQEAKPQAVELVCSVPQGCAPGTHAECVAASQLLAGPTINDPAAVERWRGLCAIAFPQSRYFGGAACVQLQADYDFDNMAEAFGKLSF